VEGKSGGAPRRAHRARLHFRYIRIEFEDMILYSKYEYRPRLNRDVCRVTTRRRDACSRPGPDDRACCLLTVLQWLLFPAKSPEMRSTL
jgi:hypothetical protein